MAEMNEVHRAARGGPLDNGRLVAELNELPERCFIRKGGRAQVRIIGWGQWALFFQRQLCHAIEHNYEFLYRRWGVKDAAGQFADECQRTFGALKFYPFVRRALCTNEDAYRKAVDDSFPVLTAMPHLTAPAVWNRTANRPGFVKGKRYIPVPDPHFNEWHKHNPPPGTAYSPGPRLYFPSLTDLPDYGERLKRLRERAPYDRELAEGLIRLKHGKSATYEELEAIYGPLLAFSMPELYKATARLTDDPVRYEQLMSSYAEKNAAGFFTLGRYFVNRSDEARAASYYEKGINAVGDPISMSNNSEWLVFYYLRNGRTNEAEALADRAAQVYSSSGLRTKAALLETQAKYPEAFEYYQKIEERYNSPGELVGFCVRYKALTDDTRYDAVVKKHLRVLFPRGLEKVALKDFTEPPTKGVVFAKDNNLLITAGLKRGDIIVALDGLRVDDMTQYQYVRDLTNAPALTLIIWNGDAYTQVSASPPRRRFGSSLKNYSKATSPPP